MSKHTNGPWFIGRQFGSNSTAIIGDGDSVVCILDGRHGSLAESDARLIAAAPDLLEVLEKVQAWMDGGEDDELAYEIDLALTKAKGE